MKRQSTYRMRALWLGVVVGLLMGGSDTARADFTFGARQNLGPAINKNMQDDGASLSADGLSLFFDSRRSGGLNGYDIWVAHRATVNDDWSESVKLGPAINRPDYSEWNPSISSDGLELYFSRGPEKTGHDLYVTTRATTDDEWSDAVSLGEMINSPAEDGFPWISADGLSLYFRSDRTGGEGGQDLYVTTRLTRNDAWSPPVNLGPAVNSSWDDFGPSISSDGLSLIFSSKRPGLYSNYADLWLARRRTILDPWGEPVNLGPEINTDDVDFASISPDGRTLYLSCWNRPGGYGLYDIYRTRIIPIADFNGDGRIEIADLAMLIENWGTDTSLYDIGPMPWGDGIVDGADLEVFMSYWGQEPYDPALIAHWTLDETEGSTARDSAGDNDGILIGQPLWLPGGGPKGGALQLDGVADHVQTAPILDPAAGPFSVFAWVQGGVPNQVIVAQADGADWLLASPSGTLATLLKGPGASRGTGLLASATTITDGLWHSVGLAWDGAVRTLHVDGIEVARDAYSQGSPTSCVNGLYLGAGSALAPASFWSGLIDDVRVYNQAVRP